jgi:hypothetical protein
MFDFRAWLRKTFTPLVGASACAAIMAGQANAGNIVLTGHDDDFHDRLDDTSIANPANQPGQQLLAMAKFARAAAPSPGLPVLVLDQGTEMTVSLQKLLGVASVVAKDPSAGLLATDFDVKKYSAIAIASATSCGGCDNTVAGYKNINAQAAAIANFFNAGGGILQTTGGTSATQRAAAYAYLPKTAGVPSGAPPTSGYFQTADGAAVPIPAVNGDSTHNFFDEPGFGGTSGSYKVFERLKDGGGQLHLGSPETIGLANAVITGTTIVGGTPEPATLSLAAMGLAGLAGYGWKRRGKK